MDIVVMSALLALWVVVAAAVLGLNRLDDGARHGH